MLRSKEKRKGIRKKIFIAGLLFTLIFQMVCAFSVSAHDIPAPTSCFYVNDFADLLTDDTEKYVESVNVQLYEKCGAQLVLTTIKSLDGAALEEYATEMFRTYGIGDKEKNNGVLILLALEDRACRIEIGYGLEGAINDAKSGRIQDAYMIPFFRDGKWDEGMRNGFDAIVGEIAKEYNIQVDSNEPTEMKTEKAEKKEAEEDIPWYKDSNTVGMIGMAIALIAGLLLGAIIPWFWIGILSCLASPFVGHHCMLAFLPEMDGFMLLMSDFGILIAYFIGWCITTRTVDKSGGGSSGGYSSSSSSSYRSSSYSSHSSSSGGYSSSHHSGGGGSSGRGGSSRRF